MARCRSSTTKRRSSTVKAETSMMGQSAQHKTKQIAPGVRLLYGIDDFECCIYLVEGSERALLIDTGCGFNDLKFEVDHLTDLSYDVVVTHGHCDHAGATCMFPKVHMARGAVGDADAAVDMNRPAIGDGRWQVMKEAEACHPSERAFVSDGFEFELGGKTLEVIENPGHTAGDISLLDKQDRILFCGDCLVQAMDVLLVVPTALTVRQYLTSMEKLLERAGEFDRICSGHDKDTLPPTFLEGAVEAARGIVSGKEPGNPAELPPVFGGIEALRAKAVNTSILYNPEKIG